MKLKKRMIALGVGVIAVMIFSFIYIVAAGDHYTLHTMNFLDSNELPETHVSVRDEGVVRLERIYMENQEIVADFTAVGQGTTAVDIRFLRGGNEFHIPEQTLTVNAFGTILDRTGGVLTFNGFRAIIYAIVAQLAMTEVIMLWMYVDYRRKSDFGYPMVACGGVSIYVLILLAYVVHYLLNNYMYSFTFFLSLVTGAGLIMLVLLTPLMLLLSVLLAVSNIWLVRHEGYRPVNALGIVFAVLWAIGTALTVGVNLLPVVWEIPHYNDVALPLIYLIGYLECMFISTVACSFLSVKNRPPYDRDYIIILGCAIRGDGTLTPLLKGRVDSAVAFEKKQYEATGRHAVFVPSGGQGDDEIISEGEAMERYLLSLGIPAERIVREDQSVNTYQNMQFSKKAIDGHGGGRGHIAFATTNYHIFRGYILAKKLGFRVRGIAAKTKPYFFPNAFLREFVGLLVDQKWKHLLFILLTAAFFTALSFV